jgi:hypothetical protein
MSWLSSVRRLSIIAIFVAPVRALLAADVTVNPSADTFLSSAESPSNYGGAGQLAISDAGRPQGEFQSLVRFDLAAARSSFDSTFGPGQWKLQSATLRLTTSNPNNALFNANLAGPFAVSWMQNDSWAEGTGAPISPTSDGVTFATLPNFTSAQDQPLGTFNFPGGNSGANTFALNLSSGLTDDVQAGGLLSMRLFADGGMTVSYNFSSRNFGTVANRPVLTVSAVAVPEPGTLGVIAAIVALCVARPRRARINPPAPPAAYSAGRAPPA